MDTVQWIVTVAGIGMIVAIAVYFLFKSEDVAMQARTIRGVQELSIIVKGGYSPSVVTVQRGTPVRLIFDRRETSSCSEDIVIPEYGIRRGLPPNEKTSIEFTPASAGTFEFACGMNMLHGSIIVE